MTHELTDELEPLGDGALDMALRHQSWTVRSLAQEARRGRALRPPCPTCHGNGTVPMTQPGSGPLPHHTFDCAVCAGSGLMPLPDHIAALRNAGDALHESLAECWNGTWAGDTPVDHRRVAALAAWDALPKPGEPTPCEWDDDGGHCLVHHSAWPCRGPGETP